MSIQVDHTSQKLTDEERGYLLQRGRRHLVLQNDRMFPDASSSAPQGSTPPEQDEEWTEQVRELTVPELQDELSNRGLSTSGKQDTLRKRLIEAGPEA